MNKEIQQKNLTATGIKLFITKNGKEVARASIFLIKNDLHPEPYALLEDVYVDEDQRGTGLGKQIVNAAIAEAKKQGCKKMIGTSRYSRPKVHQFYINLGFQDYGKEFKIEFE